jgi:putative heme transporter
MIEIRFGRRRSREAPADKKERLEAKASEYHNVGESSVPPGMQIAGAWSWRFLVLAAALAVAIWLITQLSLVVIPLLIAVVVSALLVPVSNWLQHHHVPKWVAIFITMIGVIVIIGGLLFLVVTQIVNQYDGLRAQTIDSYKDLAGYVKNSSLQLTQADINGYFKQIQNAVQSNSSTILSGAVSASSTVGHIFTGALLVLFSTLFILIDGKGIWGWIVRLFPRRGRAAADGAGQAGWLSLQNFVKVQILVAFIDAVGIGGGAAIFGVPLAFPLGVLVFLGSFIPVVGAVATGVVAVFVALVYNGPWIALIMIGVVLLVQEIEGHVLQPLVMGNAVHVHPLAVVLAVATGGFVIGITGAFFAVPLVAASNSMIKYVASGTWKSGGGVPGRGLKVDGETVAPPANPSDEPVKTSRFRRRSAGAR